MARVLFVVALALFASAAVLASNEDGDNYIYSDDQIDEINDRLASCLNVRVVPAAGDFNHPGDTCRFEGIWALSDGAVKEALTDVIVKCLTQKKVAPMNVAKASKCLTAALAKDLVAA